MARFWLAATGLDLRRAEFLVESSWYTVHNIRNMHGHGANLVTPATKGFRFVVGMLRALRIDAVSWKTTVSL